MSADTVDWDTVKRVLARISGESADFLEENILIGGAAPWFLENAKGVDFIGTPSKEIAARLGAEKQILPLIEANKLSA